MSLWLETRGYSSLAIAVCDRCKMKRSITELVSDPNAPGTFVCQRGCVDEYDPWRLPAREPEDITLEHPRPDESISTLGVSSASGWFASNTILLASSTLITASGLIIV